MAIHGDNYWLEQIAGSLSAGGSGGIYNTTQPTLSNAQSSALQLGTRGSLRVELFNSDSTTPISGVVDNTDAVAVTGSANRMSTASRLYVFNGTTFDRVRGDGTGSINTREQYAPAYEDNTIGVAKVEQRFTPTHISTSTTTVVKPGPGFLHNVVVNTLGTVASTTTIYDNTAGSGTVIAVINTLALAGTFAFDVSFSTGLTLVTTGTVAPDITVSYR